jgi:hypothetical protein
MIFRTFEHYSNDFLNEKNICFICYEIKLEDEIQPIMLNLQEDYIKMCNCNGFLHNICLQKWYDKSKKCPICRKDIYKRVTFSMIIIEKGEIFYIIFLKHINKFFFAWIFIICCQIYYVLNSSLN